MSDDLLTEKAFRELSIEDAREYADAYGVKGRGFDDLVDGLKAANALASPGADAAAEAAPELPGEPEPAGGVDAVAESAVDPDEEPERAQALENLAKLRKALDDARGEADKATAKVRSLEEEHGKLRDELYPSGIGSDDFYSAHKRHLRTLEKNKERLVADRKAQEERLAGAAPIDKAMARKTGRGTKRPAVPPKSK